MALLHNRGTFDGDNTTAGNNVDAHLDRNNDDVPDTGSRVTGSPFRVFNPALDLNQQPSVNTNAAVVHRVGKVVILWRPRPVEEE